MGFKYEARENTVRDTQGMSVGWMDAYVYNADLYCEDCGAALQEGKEDTGDSGDYPQGPYPDGGGESDGPQHCGAGEGCLNAMTFVGTKIGVWLGNPLTTDGVEYLKEMMANPDATPYQMALHEFWSDVYSDYLGEPSVREMRESGVLEEPNDLLAFNTTLAKLMQRLKKDAGAESISQNYRGTGTQAFRRQLWVRFKSGAVIDLWLENSLGFGGVVMNRPPGNAPGVLPKRLSYDGKTPEEVYAEAAKLLKEWATPDAGNMQERRGVREPKPVDDPDYIIQGLYSDSRIESEFGFNDQNVALDEAKKLLRAPWFEGDYVRIITRDGELVWDSRGRGHVSESSHRVSAHHTVREAKRSGNSQRTGASDREYARAVLHLAIQPDALGTVFSARELASQIGIRRDQAEDEIAKLLNEGLIVETERERYRPTAHGWVWIVGLDKALRYLLPKTSETHEGRHTVRESTHEVRETGMLEDRTLNNSIRIWMKANANRFTDPRTGELNTTALVEAWDIERADGRATLDPNHPAWDIATEFAGYQSAHESRHTVREVNFHHGERLRIRIKGPQGQPFESFWYTVDTQGMSLTDVALQFAQAGQPGMFIEIVSPTNSAGTQPRLKWTFQVGRHAGQLTVTRVKGTSGESGVLEERLTKRFHVGSHELNTIREIIEEELYDWGQDPLGQKPGYLSPIAADAGVSIREVDRLAAAVKRVEHKNATELERLHYQIGDLIDEMREQVKNASLSQIEGYMRAREEWIGS